MIVKVHRSPQGTIVTVCDEDILGKKFIEGKKVLDLTSSFFKGEEMNDTRVEKLASTAPMVHAIGKTSIAFLLKHQLIEKNNVQSVDGIPHIQILRF